MKPGLGRFTQADRWGGSVWSPWASHPFVYCGNNPIGFVDPLGLFELNWSATQSGFVSGFTSGIYSFLEGGYTAILKFAASKIPILGQAMFVYNLVQTTRQIVDTSRIAIQLASGAISDKEISEMIGQAIGEKVASLVTSKAAVSAGVLAVGITAKVKSKLKSGGGGKKPLRRPYVRKNVRKAVEDNAVKIGDNFVDPNTGKIIQGKYDLGHKTGSEFRRLKAQAEIDGLTQKNLIIC
jgi:hypothetical protein